MLHCCWLIDLWKPSRSKYLESWLSLGAPITLWHAGQLEASPHPRVTLRDARELFQGSVLGLAWNYELRHRNHAACADLLRYEALFQLGGAYFDLDVMPNDAVLSQESLAQLLERGVPRFGSRLARPVLKANVEIRFLCAPREHYVLRVLRDAAAWRTAEYVDQGGHAQGITVRGVLDRTGPAMVAQMLDMLCKGMDPKARSERIVAWLLAQATLDSDTNRSEHFRRRFAEIDAIAGYAGRSN